MKLENLGAAKLVAINECLMDTILKLKSEKAQLIDLIEYVKAIDITLPDNTKKHFNDLYNKLNINERY